MKRLHFLILLFSLSFYACATPATKINPVEIRPIGSDQLNLVWSINRDVAMAPPIRPVSPDVWNPLMQAMRATIEEQTNEINSLKLRISIVENKLKDNER